MQKNLFKYTYNFPKSELDKLYYKETNGDCRIKIPEEKISSFPYSAIGLLKMTYPHETVSYRTGVLISKNCILTAGHNLFDLRTNPNCRSELLESPVNIEFYPGITNNKSNYKFYEHKKFFVDKKNIRKEDYGVIILKEPVEENIGFFNLKIFEEKNDMNNICYNCGYPFNKTTGDNNVFYQYEDKGKILEIENEDVIVTGIKSSYGQSGAGLFFCKDNKYYVIGVHVASSFFDDRTYATMINQKRFEQIQSWIKDDNII